MKRFVLCITMFLLIGVTVAFAADTVRYSTQTADAQIAGRKALLHAFLVVPDGTNDVTVVIYDSLVGSGNQIYPSMTFAGDGGAQALPIATPIECETGIYVDITTAGTAGYTILYKLR